MSSRIFNVPNSSISHESRPPQRLFLHRKSSPVTVANFFQIYFTFAYYLCIAPFRIVFCEDKRWFQLRTSGIQKIFCIFLHIFSSVFIHIDWQVEYSNLQAKPIPTKYFFGATDIIHYIFKIYCIKVFFFDGQRFLNILNFAVSERDVFADKLQIENSYWLVLLHGLNIFLALARASEQIIPRKGGSNRVWPWEDEKYVEVIRSFYFSTKNVTDSNTFANGTAPISSLDYVLVIVTSLSCTASAIVGYFMDMIVLFSVLTLWSPSYSISSKVKPISAINFGTNYYRDEQVDEEEKHDETDETIEKHLTFPVVPTKGASSQVKIISNYFLEENMTMENQQLEKMEQSYHSFKCIYTLSELINHATGHMITFYMARAIFFNSASMDDAFVSSGNNERILWKFISGFYTLTNVTISVLAADAHRRMEDYKVSFYDEDKMTKLPCDRLQAIISELNALKVGIKGSKMFTVTFGLLWNVLSTVITYFIICLQDN